MTSEQLPEVGEVEEFECTECGQIYGTKAEALSCADADVDDDDDEDEADPDDDYEDEE